MASDPAYRSSAFRGFRHQNTLHFGFAIGEIPMATWQLEPRAIMGYTWRHNVRSGFRRSGVCGRSEPRHLNRRFSDREIPDRDGALTLDHRGSGLGRSCAECSRLANSRPTIFRFPEVCGSKPLNIASSEIPTEEVPKTDDG